MSNAALESESGNPVIPVNLRCIISYKRFLESKLKKIDFFVKLNTFMSKEIVRDSQSLSLSLPLSLSQTYLLFLRAEKMDKRFTYRNKSPIR